MVIKVKKGLTVKAKLELLSPSYHLTLGPMVSTCCPKQGIDQGELVKVLSIRLGIEPATSGWWDSALPLSWGNDNGEK